MAKGSYLCISIGRDKNNARSAATIKFSSWQESPLLAELKWGFHCSRESRFSVSSFPLFKYLADPEFPAFQSKICSSQIMLRLLPRRFLRDLKSLVLNLILSRGIWISKIQSHKWNTENTSHQNSWRFFSRKYRHLPVFWIFLKRPLPEFCDFYLKRHLLYFC